MKSTIYLLLAAAAAPTVLGHGYVARVTINGKAYTGNEPAADPSQPSVIREVSDVSPVKGATNKFLTCGLNAQPAALDANANPGDQMTFQWLGGDGSNWPHNTGPMLTYMANCGDQTCDKFDQSQARWFKVEEVGQEPNSDTWVQARLMQGAVANVTLPATLAAGNYLIRHEIIALHLGDTLGGAEFYPSCTQLIVGGDQTGAPMSSELVSLPGAYSDNDPGILVPDVFNPGFQYTSFPGPPIAAFVNAGASGSSSGSSNSSSPSGTASAASPSNTASSSSSSGKGKCTLKKKTSSTSNNARREVKRPRHISRVMRGLGFQSNSRHLH